LRKLLLISSSPKIIAVVLKSFKAKTALAGLVEPFIKPRDAGLRIPIEAFDLAIDLNARLATDSINEDN